MANLRNRLPPPNSLVVFEAAARHLNFTRAARELNVTQAAVSRQIQLLEDHLGTRLFQRKPRALSLSADGTRFQQAVTIGLEHIANTATQLKQSGRQGEVTVATSVTFASYWLMSRVAKFRVAHPDIELRLVASAPVADMAVAGIDLAIRYGRGLWPGAKAIHFLDNDVIPVCAPSYLKDRPPLRGPADLLGESLIHLQQFDRNWVSWDSWLRAFGVVGDTARKGPTFDNYLVLVQAALNGQGIALIGVRLAEDFLAQGMLVRPVEATLHSEQAFYLLKSADQALTPPAQVFWDWILAEARSDQEATAATDEPIAKHGQPAGFPELLDKA